MFKSRCIEAMTHLISYHFASSSDDRSTQILAQNVVIIEHVNTTL